MNNEFTLTINKLVPSGVVGIVQSNAPPPNTYQVTDHYWFDISDTQHISPELPHSYTFPVSQVWLHIPAVHLWMSILPLITQHNTVQHQVPCNRLVKLPGSPPLVICGWEEPPGSQQKGAKIFYDANTLWNKYLQSAPLLFFIWWVDQPQNML